MNSQPTDICADLHNTRPPWTTSREELDALKNLINPEQLNHNLFLTLGKGRTRNTTDDTKHACMGNIRTTIYNFFSPVNNNNSKHSYADRHLLFDKLHHSLNKMFSPFDEFGASLLSILCVNSTLTYGLPIILLTHRVP